MERVTLCEIMETAPGIERVGKGEIPTFKAPETADATLLCSGAAELIQIDRLAEVTLAAGHLVARSRRNEVFYLPYDRIVGLRLRDGGGATSDRGAGFR